MKRFYLLILIILISSQIKCQIIEKIPKEINDFNNKEIKYEMKVRAIVRRYLIHEDFYDILSADALLDSVNYLLIPMFKMQMKDSSYDYTNEKNLLASLVLDRKLLFHDAIMFKNNQLFGVYGCTDIGDCDASLYQESPDTYKDYIYSIGKLKSIDFKQVFYIKGILWAW